MKIVKTEVFLLSCPFPDPIKLSFHGGERTILKRDAALIRVTADNGLVGYAPGMAHERAAREIREVIAPFLEGKDPAQWSNFVYERVFEGDLELTKTYHSVEVAVIDLAARYEGAPFSELIGGRVRDRIKCYGSAGMYMPPEQYAEEAAAVEALGFTAYKMRPAAGPDADLDAVRAMRASVSDDFGLMLDAHAWWRMGDNNYSPQTVERMAGELGRQGVTWLEEPLPPADHAGYRRLHDKNLVPLASGEHEPSEESFHHLIASGGVDYVQADVCCQGGVRMGARLLAAVGDAGLRFAFHNWGTLLEAVAAAQIGVCQPDEVVEWLEYPLFSNAGRLGMYPFPAADEILADPLQIVGGELIVPDGPGLGVQVNEDVIDKYPFQPGPWSIFRLDSPPQTLAVGGDHSVAWAESGAGG